MISLIEKEERSAYSMHSSCYDVNYDIIDIKEGKKLRSAYMHITHSHHYDDIMVTLIEKEERS